LKAENSGLKSEPYCYTNLLCCCSLCRVLRDEGEYMDEGGGVYDNLLVVGTGVPLMFHENGGTNVLRIIDMY
jgi:hypothetical protein